MTQNACPNRTRRFSASSASRLSRNLVSSAHQSACEGEAIRSLEFAREFDQRDWLLSFTGEKRWVGIARWFPQDGFARVREYGPILDTEDRHYRVN
jgi:hypothetical protein